MGYQTYSEEWNDLVSSTAAHFIPGVFRQTITDHPLLRRFMSKTKDITGMGKQIEFIVSFGDNESVQFITSPAQSFTFSSQAIITKGKVDPSLLVGHVLFEETEKRQNSSDEQIANLVEERIAQLRETFERKLSKALFSNGTLSGKSCTKGLGFWVPTNPGSLTIATLPETSYPWWKSQNRASCGSWATNGYGGSTLNYPRNMYLSCTDGSRRPNLIVSSQGVFELFHDYLLSKVQITMPNNFRPYGDSTVQPDTPFESFMGTEYIWDKDCPAGTMLFLHTDSFHLAVTPGMNFDMLPIQRIPNQPLLSYQFMMLRHELICVRRNWQGRTSGWTESNY